MKNIIILAKQFREAIDIAYENGEFRRLYPFSKFPRDCCEHACDLLGQFLLENGIKTFQVNGACIDNESWRHVWLVTKEGIVIDITGDQFANELVSEYEVELVHVGEESEIHKIFSLDRISQNNTNFADKSQFDGFGNRPNIRQQRLMDIYKIICKYIKMG